MVFITAQLVSDINNREGAPSKDVIRISRTKKQTKLSTIDYLGFKTTIIGQGNIPDKFVAHSKTLAVCLTPEQTDIMCLEIAGAFLEFDGEYSTWQRLCSLIRMFPVTVYTSVENCLLQHTRDHRRENGKKVRRDKGGSHVMVKQPRQPRSDKGKPRKNKEANVIE